MATDPRVLAARAADAAAGVAEYHQLSSNSTVEDRGDHVAIDGIVCPVIRRGRDYYGDLSIELDARPLGRNAAVSWTQPFTLCFSTQAEAHHPRHGADGRCDIVVYYQGYRLRTWPDRPIPAAL